MEEGRPFTDADISTARQVVIVSRDTARLLFQEDNPVGRTIELPVLWDGANRTEEMTVIGVASNVKFAGLDQPPDAVAYRPYAQQPWTPVFLVARTTGNAATLASQLAREIGLVDRSILVSDVMTLDSAVSNAAALPLFRTVILLTFSLIAVVIAAIGLYGVVTFTVSERIPEFGVRVALGAAPYQILKMIVTDGMVLTVIGSLLGLAGAFVSARALTRPPLRHCAFRSDVLRIGLAHTYRRRPIG